MNGIHERARELMLDLAIGELSAGDSAWLARHLAECDACRRQQEELAASVHVLRAASVNAPPFLAARTRAGVHARATQIEQNNERRNILWLVMLFDIGWTALAITLCMNAARWFGVALGTHWMWMLAVTWFWLLPGLAGLVFVFLKKNGHLPHAPAWHWLGAEGGDLD